MGLWKKLFGPTPNCDDFVSAKPGIPWKLTCPRCGTVYVLGKDSTVYSRESLIARIGSAKIITYSDGSRPSRSDMVAKFNLKNRTLSEANEESLRNLNLIRASLVANDADRKWYCYKCSKKGVKKEYDYPALSFNHTEMN